MKTILHKIVHLLGWNHGHVYSWYEGDELMMSWRCNTCFKKEGIHPINKVIDIELTKTP